MWLFTLALFHAYFVLCNPPNPTSDSRASRAPRAPSSLSSFQRVASTNCRPPSHASACFSESSHHPSSCRRESLSTLDPTGPTCSIAPVRRKALFLALPAAALAASPSLRRIRKRTGRNHGCPWLIKRVELNTYTPEIDSLHTFLSRTAENQAACNAHGIRPQLLSRSRRHQEI